MAAYCRRYAVLLIIMMFSFFCPDFCSAGNDSGYSVKRVGNIVSFKNNSFLVQAPESGKLTIQIHDDHFVYRTIEQNVSCGENEIKWDGCGYNHEKLYPMTYTVTCELTGESGGFYSVSFASPVEYTGQSLQYALPSDEAVWLDAPDEWFLEYKTVMKGQVTIEFSSNENQDHTYSYQMPVIGGKIYRKTFAEIVRKRIPLSGYYHVSVFEDSCPDDCFEFNLQILQGSPEKQQIFITGEIMPSAEMNDNEIWKMMMLPSVVADIDFFKHQAVYSEPEPKSKVLGTIHGQTQALKVISIEGDWALIGAWNHEDAEYVEGWVPKEKLKVEKPQDEYALLIDKQNQTLTVFQKGKRIETLQISSGLPEKKALYQETSAGVFLTGYHRVDFSMNGKKYDYVIQYDGGNLLHQIPYAWGKGKKDFTPGQSVLGRKASHACIRIQAAPGANGINAYWIWTHIPYHTRIVILDDPAERREDVQKLN